MRETQCAAWVNTAACSGRALYSVRRTVTRDTPVMVAAAVGCWRDTPVTVAITQTESVVAAARAGGGRARLPAHNAVASVATTPEARGPE